MYFEFPETALLSLEEIGKQFGDEVAVHVNDATEEQREKMDDFLRGEDFGHEKSHSAVESSRDKAYGTVHTEGQAKLDSEV